MTLRRRRATPDPRGLLLFLVAAGTAARAVHYFSRSSFRVDEAALALNLAARPFPELFAPLDLAQVAPWGFLALEKGLFLAFGRSELGLRLLPFLASVAALALFAGLCRRVLSGPAIPFAAGSFALATGLIDYAGQLKQYSTDVAAAVAVLFLAAGLRQGPLTPRRALVLGAVGLGACALSQSVVFVLAGIGIALVVLAAAGKVEAPAPALVVLGGSWALGAAFVGWSGLRMVTPEVRGYLRQFWASAFMPLEPAEGAAWLGRQILRVFEGFLDYSLPAPFVAFVLLGAVTLLRRDLAAGLFFSIPLLLTLAASAARLYPFAPGRVTAFLVPILLVFAAEGVERARTLPPRRLAWAGAAVAAAAAAVPIWAVVRNPPPYMPEHVRPALERLRTQWRPGDALYVHYGARLPFLFYEPILGLTDGTRVLGECARDDPRRYLAQLDAMRGRPRCWVLLAHDLPVFSEGRLILSYVDRIGRRLERADYRSRGDPSPVILAAYDLTGRERLSSAAAETFPVPAVERGAAEALPCAGTMGPLPAGLTSGRARAEASGSRKSRGR